MNYLRAQRVVHRQISRFGKLAALRRASVDRTCMAATVDFSTSDREGSLIQFGDLRVLISAYSLIGKEPPNPDQGDSLILNSIEYKILAPASKLCADNVTVLYWELQARK